MSDLSEKIEHQARQYTRKKFEDFNPSVGFSQYIWEAFRDGALAQKEDVSPLVEAAQAVLWLNECRCDDAYTSKGKHEPNACCGELDPLREALEMINE